MAIIKEDIIVNSTSKKGTIIYNHAVERVAAKRAPHGGVIFL